MVEKQDIPEPKKNTPNAPTNTGEAGNLFPESLKKPSEKTEKPGEKLEGINQKIKEIYPTLLKNREKLAGDNQDEGGSQDKKDRKDAEKQLTQQENVFKKHETEYQTEIESALTDAKGKFSTKQHPLIEQKGLVKSVTDLHYDTEPLDESRVQFLAKTFPEAWEKAIVDPNIDLSSNTELALVRERIQGKLRSTEQEILKNSAGLSKEEVQKKLADNFQKITGIETNQDTFKKYVSQQVDSSLVDDVGKDIPSESFAPSATRGFSAGGSSDVPNGDENIGDPDFKRPKMPVEPSEMSRASYQWQGSGFKMRGPLKDISASDRSPTLLAQLAKQGTNPDGSTGTCYKSVKNHLCAAGYVDSSYKMTQGSAQNAASDLQGIGFSNVGPNIGNAQVGDVCVYSGGAHGHIEIKTGDGYASDFFTNRASGRKLIGVWRPPISGPVGPQNIAGVEKKTQIS